MFDHISFDEPVNMKEVETFAIEVFYGGEFICKGIATKEKEIEKC